MRESDMEIGPEPWNHGFPGDGEAPFSVYELTDPDLGLAGDGVPVVLDPARKILKILGVRRQPAGLVVVRRNRLQRRGV
jgi:hypothetical protein